MAIVVTHDHKVFKDALVALDVRLRFDTVGVFCDYAFGMCAGLGAPSVTLDGDCCMLHFVSPFVFRAAARKGWLRLV